MVSRLVFALCLAASVISHKSSGA